MSKKVWAETVVAPAVATLGLAVMVRVSARTHTAQEANQLGGAVILPLIFLAVGQSTGLLLVTLPIAVGIGAVIWVERSGQKGIVIGKGGERLREIGARSRIQMERLFDSKVFLETWVRVREGWSDDEAALKSLGYHD